MRRATPADAEAIGRIFDQAVEERIATFETARPGPDAWRRRIASGDELLLVAERDGRVVAWAAAGPYSDAHEYYAGIREATLYVERSSRRSGIGAQLLDALAAEARRDGAHKLVGKIFTTNDASIALVVRCGFREVGVHCRHGRLDGEWRDVLVVERLLGAPEDP